MIEKNFEPKNLSAFDEGPGGNKMASPENESKLDAPKSLVTVEIAEPPRETTEEQVIAYHTKEIVAPFENPWGGNSGERMQRLEFEMVAMPFFPEDDCTMLWNAAASGDTGRVREIVTQRIVAERALAADTQHELRVFLVDALPRLARHFDFDPLPIRFAVWSEMESKADSRLTDKRRGSHGGMYHPESGVTYALTNSLR